ncbi:MAG UNVERIFIED_CONTAM: hypothetical protein LVR18_11635 [Planctomycetaceae bacterium]
MDLTAWNDPSADLPIGVFDSGIGGLTVLEAILAADHFQNDSLQPGSDGIADFRNERFIYLGDQANMPYGNYSSAGKPDFLKELILRDAAFLLGRRFHPAPGSPSEAASPRFDKTPRESHCDRLQHSHRLRTAGTSRDYRKIEDPRVCAGSGGFRCCRRR